MKPRHKIKNTPGKPAGRLATSLVIASALVVTGFALRNVLMDRLSDNPASSSKQGRISFAERIKALEQHAFDKGIRLDADAIRSNKYLSHLFVNALKELESELGIENRRAKQLLSFLLGQSCTFGKIYPDVESLFNFGELIPYKSKLDEELEKAGFRKIEIREETIRERKSKPTIEDCLHSRVCYFGDSHDSAWLIRRITERLPELKAAGYTHVGIEADIERQGSLQKVIEGFQPSFDVAEDNIRTLRAQRKLNRRGKLALSHWENFLERRKAEQEFFVKVKELGLEIVFMDKRRKGEGLDIEFRDKAMAKKIAGVLAKKGTKLAVVSGATHVRKSSVPKRVEELCGETGPTYLFSGEFENAVSEFVPFNAYDLEFRRSGLSREEFILRLESQGVDYDYLWHLPQTRGVSIYEYEIITSGDIDAPRPWESFLVKKR